MAARGRRRARAVADQSAANPRSRRGCLADSGDRAHGPARAAARLGCGGGALGVVRRRPRRGIAAAIAAQHRRAGGADRLLPRRDDGDRRGQPYAGRAHRDARRAVGFRALSGRFEARAAGHVASFQGRGKPRRAADGGAAGGVLVARPGRTVRKFAEFGGSIRQAPRPDASSSSRNGRTKGSPCPIPLQKNWSRTVRRRLARVGPWMVGGRRRHRQRSTFLRSI